MWRDHIRLTPICIGVTSPLITHDTPDQRICAVSIGPALSFRFWRTEAGCVFQEGTETLLR